jgi:hypothetical protein
MNVQRDPSTLHCSCKLDVISNRHMYWVMVTLPHEDSLSLYMLHTGNLNSQLGVNTYIYARI